MANTNRFTKSQHQARAFFTLLEGENAPETEFDFRTFDDDKTRKSRALIRKTSGKFGVNEQFLRDLNAQGAGVFAVINAGGQTDEEISRVRAVFADTDGAPLEPLVEALTPHIIVCSSSRKWHVYWFVRPDFPVESFKPIQQAIAKQFGTDPSICNPSRVMRIPGFKHNKSDPFDVEIISAKSFPAYSMEEIVEGLGLQDALEKRSSRTQSDYDDPAFSTKKPTLKDIEHILKFIDPWRYDVWRNIIFILATEYGEEARDLAVRWSSGNSGASRGFDGAHDGPAELLRR